MIIVPELKIVIIQPPRTGSTSLRNCIKTRYPKAMQLYRHMEAAGTPIGYDSYDILYVSRDPVSRLRSLWKYMQVITPTRLPKAPIEWIARQNADASRSFVDWMNTSTEIFNDGDKSPDSAYYSTNRDVPAARKNMRDFTQTFPQREVNVVRHDAIGSMLGLDMPSLNQSFSDGWVPTAEERIAAGRWHHDEMMLRAGAPSSLKSHYRVGDWNV